MNIGIFCSSRDIFPEAEIKHVEALGKWIGENGHALVYGGCNVGLMGCIANSVKDNGGKVIGVTPSTPELFANHARNNKILDKFIEVSGLPERKAVMTEESDVMVALPGGIGTLDEIFTVISEAMLNYHNKMVILDNTSGFYNTLMMFINELQMQGVASECERVIEVANTFDELISLIEKYGNK